MTCDNQFHRGPRPSLHEKSQECRLIRLHSGGVVCDNRCHTHPEHPARVVDTPGALKLFEIIVNGYSIHMTRISRQELEDCASFYLGMGPEEVLEVLRRRKIAWVVGQFDGLSGLSAWSPK